jgi:hypothetical protein
LDGLTPRACHAWLALWPLWWRSGGTLAGRLLAATRALLAGLGLAGRRLAGSRLAGVS